MVVGSRKLSAYCVRCASHATPEAEDPRGSKVMKDNANFVVLTICGHTSTRNIDGVSIHIGSDRRVD